MEKPEEKETAEELKILLYDWLKEINYKDKKI